MLPPVLNIVYADRTDRTLIESAYLQQSAIGSGCVDTATAAMESVCEQAMQACLSVCAAAAAASRRLGRSVGGVVVRELTVVVGRLPYAAVDLWATPAGERDRLPPAQLRDSDWIRQRESESPREGERESRSRASRAFALQGRFPGRPAT